MDKINKTLIIGINLCDHGSTGTIMRHSLEYAHEHGNFDYLVCVPKDEGKPHTFAFNYQFNIFRRALYNRILKLYKRYPDGYLYREYTRKLINKIKSESKKYNKTIIHLHNIHMAGIQFPMLFKYLSKTNFKIFYTLHDSWPFTGGCYCFNFIKCFEWQNGCKCKCCQNYDKKCISVQKNYKLKKKYTLLLKKQLTLIPVSQWMVNNLQKSFLRDIPYILNPGECSIMPLDKPDINLKRKLGLIDKKVLISVSAYWNDWKGIKYIYELADLIPNNYKILLVGGSLLKEHKNIIHVGNVNNSELNRYYSIADVFISTTQDDNLPLVLMEAQICGLPIVGFGHGGTREEIIEGKTGTMVGTNNNINKLICALVHVLKRKQYKKEDIIINGKKYEPFEHAKRMLTIYEKV